MKSLFLPVNHKFPGFLFYVIPVLDPTFCARTKGYQEQQISHAPQGGPSSGIPILNAIDIWGWIILCCGGLSCALLDV